MNKETIKQLRGTIINGWKYEKHSVLAPVLSELLDAAERIEQLDEISRERARQDEQWGGATHDDSHERFEWCQYIHKQNDLALSESRTARNFEQRMVKIAALALAAIESSRRQRKEKADA